MAAKHYQRGALMEANCLYVNSFVIYCYEMAVEV
jgi:hypothetical protein